MLFNILIIVYLIIGYILGILMYSIIEEEKNIKLISLMFGITWIFCLAYYILFDLPFQTARKKYIKKKKEKGNNVDKYA